MVECAPSRSCEGQGACRFGAPAVSRGAKSTNPGDGRPVGRSGIWRAPERIGCDLLFRFSYAEITAEHLSNLRPAACPDVRALSRGFPPDVKQISVLRDASRVPECARHGGCPSACQADDGRYRASRPRRRSCQDEIRSLGSVAAIATRAAGTGARERRSARMTVWTASGGRSGSPIWTTRKDGERSSRMTSLTECLSA